MASRLAADVGDVTAIVQAHVKDMDQHCTARKAAVLAQQKQQLAGMHWLLRSLRSMNASLK